MRKDQSKRYVVDRRDGDFLVLVDEGGKSVGVSAKELPIQCRREGAVMDIPLMGSGYPSWRRAVRNVAEEQRRLKESAEQLARLRGRDPDAVEV